MWIQIYPIKTDVDVTVTESKVKLNQELKLEVSKHFNKLKTTNQEDTCVSVVIFINIRWAEVSLFVPVDTWLHKQLIYLKHSKHHRNNKTQRRKTGKIKPHFFIILWEKFIFMILNIKQGSLHRLRHCQFTAS